MCFHVANAKQPIERGLEGPVRAKTKTKTKKTKHKGAEIAEDKSSRCMNAV